MAKVSLRVYSREIEGMIEVGQLEEAIAHCQNILKIFPMHVETYRLLGKSLLEARRYTDAADIFQRVLMVVPDDFVAHVGMSIIRDDEGKLDNAIWHMERAFEGQPSNPAIQGELRRLYGRRDGIEPPKIRLSRDALANMYAQGELFNQAIAEIRALLSEDTNRPDLQVMLARAYYRAGQKVEAAEMAANLLKKHTYCLDALRILVDVLPGSARVENTQVYRLRLRQLDPYSPFVNGSTFGSNQVPEATVNLERLEYSASTYPAMPQSNWASSFGIKVTEERLAELAPDRINIGETEDTSPTLAPDSSVSDSDNEFIPDWMRSADWIESVDNAREEPLSTGMEASSEQITQADIPDWLKAMAPQEITQANVDSEPNPATLPSPGGDEIPDWFKDMPSQELPASNTSSGVVPVIPLSPGGKKTSNIPVEPGFAGVESNHALSQPMISPNGDRTFPDWLNEIDDSTTAGATAAASAGDAVVHPQPEETPASTQPASPASTDQLDIEQPASAPGMGGEPTILITGDSSQLEIEDETIAWLDGLVKKQDIKEEELLDNPEDRLEGMPDWLRSPDGQPASSGTPARAPAQGATLPLDPIPSSPGESLEQESNFSAKALPPQMAPFEGTSQPQKIEDETTAWLKGLAADQGTKEEELQDNPKDRLEEMPDWLRSPYGQSDSSTAPARATASGATIPLDPILPSPGESLEQESNISAQALPPQMAPFEGTSQPQKIEDETMAWLEGLAADQGTKEGILQTKSEDRLEGIPGWLQSPNGPQASPAITELSPPLSIETLPLEAQTLAGEFETLESVPADELPLQMPTAEVISQPLVEEDPTARLEGVADKQGTQPEGSLTDRLASSGTPPEWIQGTNQEQPAPTDAPAPVIPEEDISINSWLSKLDGKEDLNKNQPIPHVEQPVAMPSNNFPDWLKEMEKPSAPLETQNPIEVLPDWLRQPALPVKQKTAATPTPEHVPEPEMPAWVDEEIPVSDQPTPTNPEEWVSMDEKFAPVRDIEPIAEPVAVVAKTPLLPRYPKPTGILSPVPTQDKEAELLASAQALLDANKLNESMQAYTLLIKKKHLLDEVIHDLREAIYRFPVDIIVWQTLGDASIRANHLQDALDAYTKAEELLR